MVTHAIRVRADAGRGAELRDPQERPEVRRGAQPAARGHLRASAAGSSRARTCTSRSGTSSTTPIDGYVDGGDRRGLRRGLGPRPAVDGAQAALPGRRHRRRARRGGRRRPRRAHRRSSSPSGSRTTPSAAYDRREEELGAEIMRELERRVVLSVLDRKWREHLYEMDYLQEGIGLRAMAQRDPLVEYQREGFDMFTAMMDGIKEESVGYLFNLEVQVEEAPPAARRWTCRSAAPVPTLAPPTLPTDEARPPSRSGRVPPALRAKGLDVARPQHVEYSAPSWTATAASCTARTTRATATLGRRRPERQPRRAPAPAAGHSARSRWPARRRRGPARCSASGRRHPPAAAPAPAPGGRRRRPRTLGDAVGDLAGPHGAEHDPGCADHLTPARLRDPRRTAARAAAQLVVHLVADPAPQLRQWARTQVHLDGRSAQSRRPAARVRQVARAGRLTVEHRVGVRRAGCGADAAGQHEQQRQHPLLGTAGGGDAVRGLRRVRVRRALHAQGARRRRVQQEAHDATRVVRLEASGTCRC